MNPSDLEALLSALTVDSVVVNKSQYEPAVLTSYLAALLGKGDVPAFVELEN